VIAASIEESGGSFVVTGTRVMFRLRVARTSVSRQPPGIDQAALAE